MLLSLFGKQRLLRMKTGKGKTSAKSEGPSRSPGALKSHDRESGILALQQSGGNQAVGELLRHYHGEETQTAASNGIPHRGTVSHAPPFPVSSNEVVGLMGPGKVLSPEVQLQLAARYQHDFSNVRVHDDVSADYLAKTFGARAFAADRHIGFRRGKYDPASSAGRELLVHEAGHIASATRRTATASDSVQLDKDIIDDVTTEMVGLPFKVRSDQGTTPNLIPKGTTVTVTDWKALGRTATVEATVKGVKITLDVPKLSLDPAVPGKSGVRSYRVGLGAQQVAVEKAAKDVIDQRAKGAGWKTKESDYKKKPKAWQDEMDDINKELKRREEVIAKKESTLSQMLVRETMYNRFDPVIAKWVDHYNKTLKPKKDLDPNIVKSMLFRETRMGTIGNHLELPPYSWADSKKHPMRSRFNVMQAIDSYSEEQLVMIEEMANPIFKKHRLDELKKAHQKKGMSNSELWDWNSGALNKAVKDYMAVDAGTNQNLMGTVGKELFLDYEYWIRTGVRWLFYKYSITDDWPEAVRAFVGRPDPKKAPQKYKDSLNYKKSVMSRVGDTKDLDVGNQ